MQTTTGRRGVSGRDEVEDGGGSMRILVLPRDGIRPLFYHEEVLERDDDPSEVDEPITTASGIRVRVRRVFRGIGRAEHHAPTWLRAPILWLKSKLPADERLLMGLRGAHRVTLVHPTLMEAEEVRSAWSSYLDSRFRQRIGWLAFYAVVLAPSVALSLLPGPNVVGLWVTYRLIAHGLALYGIGRTRRGRIEIAGRASPRLDGPVIADRGEAERVQKHFRMHGLKGRLKRERVFARLRIRQRRAGRPVMGEGD